MPRGGGVVWDGDGGSDCGGGRGRGRGHGRGRGRGGGRGGKMASTTRRVHTRSVTEATALHVATQNCTRCGCTYTPPCTIPYKGTEDNAVFVCDNCKVAEANMSFLHDPVAARWQFRPLTRDEIESPAGDTLPQLITLPHLSTPEMEAQMKTVLSFDCVEDDCDDGFVLKFDMSEVKRAHTDGGLSVVLKY